jgi:hypothetical protein
MTQLTLAVHTPDRVAMKHSTLRTIKMWVGLENYNR